MKEAETGMMNQQAKECQRLPATPEAKREAWNRFSPQGIRENMVPIPSFQTSRLRNCERVSFCCLKPPRLWYFVTAALRN